MKKLLLTGAAAVAAIACQAGIKYWDNPAYKSFDVGDYVQDGLVVNYDGIRNAGPNAPHDSTATTWVNCANPGTYDMTRYSLVDSAWVAGASKGYWTDYGFVFNKDAVFNESAAFTLPTAFSHQILLDAKASDQNGIGYPVCGAAAGATSSYTPQNWQYGASIGLRSSGDIANTMYFTPMNENTNTKRPAIPGGTYTYGTAILNGNDAVLFDGIKAPWSATDTGGTTGHLKKTSYSPTERTCQVGICLGGHYGRTDETFKGTVKSYRFYTKCLSDEEVAWNRVVDEARYFHRRGALPVTNVVVATTIPGNEDDHFALDAEGYTFTAPSSKTVAGKRYVLGGYTLETWNGSAWGSPVSHNGENSCTLADTSAKVRLTWQYSRPAGEGQLAHYDVSDYVWDGLMLFYDGIYNQGTNAVHSYSATTWVNIGIGDGVDRTLSRQHKITSGDPGCWDADGYVFKGYSDFNKKSTSLLQPATHSIQTLVDAKISDQIYGSIAYVYATAWDFSSLALRTANDNLPKANSFYWVTQKDQPKGRPYILHDNKQYSYATAIQNGTDNTLRFFEGTDIPSSGGNADGFVELEAPATNFTASNFFLGGYNSSSSSLMAGKMKFFRFYPNKALTAAEVAQNRKVDEYRYFGRYVVTNVLVQSTYSYLEGYDACGPYEVDGSYTFVAPESVTAQNGITYACDGYTVETLKANGTWGAAVSYDTNAYTATDSGTVRLTWRWKATHGLRSAADYDVTDYVSGGLKLHFDGIANVGIGNTRSTTATKWVNLGSNGAVSDASLTKGSGSSSAWTDDGYYFDGDAKFTIANAGIKANSSYTLQLLTDVDRSIQKLENGTGGQHDYFFSGSYNQLAVSVYNRGRAYLRAGADINFALATGEHLTYFTGMMDQTGSSPVAYVFPGTSLSSATKSTSASLTTPTVNSPILGAWGGGTSQYGIGTIKNFRYYDRPLTDAELARNREVDQARYFGALATTNVFVVAGGGVQTETGAYKVEGEWMFSAATTVNRRGETVPVARYSIETLVNGEWTNKQICNGNTYTYTVGTSPAMVRLKWLGQPVGTVISVK